MKVGQRAQARRSFGPQEVADYRLLGGGGDDSSVPEPLIGGLFSYLLGVQLPGLGTNYLKQETEFLQPAPLGRTLIAEVEITRIRTEKHLVDLSTTCRLEDGSPIARGRALVYVKDVVAGEDSVDSKP